MRIRELELIRFGKFTDRCVSLPHRTQDIHLIVGPNEAGKSTLRTAIGAWLFGIPVRTPFAFVHPMSDLRLGGVLERLAHGNGSAQQLAFHRVKASKNTLRDPLSDQPLPDAVLAPWLGPLQAAGFAAMHALDHEALTQGGAGILSAADDVGRMLFQSAAGIQHLDRALQQIEAEADGLWGNRRSASRLFTQLEDSLKQAKEQLKAHTLRAKEWQERRAELDAVGADLKQAQDENAGLLQRLSRLERLRRVAPLLLRLDALQAQLDGLGNEPLLPADAARQLQQARQDQVRAQADMQRLRAQDAQLRQAFDGLVQQPEVLALAAEIEALADLRRRYGQHRQDIALRQQERQAAWESAKALAQGMQWPHDSEGALRSRLPAAPVRHQLNRLLKDHPALLQRQQDSAAQLQARIGQVEQLREQLTQVGATVGGEALEAALELALQLGDRDARQFEIEARVARATRQVEQALAALGQWREAPETLKSMLVPELSRIQAMLDDQRADEQEARGQVDALAQHRAKQAQLALTLDQLVSMHQPVSREQVQQARAQRDALWQSLLTSSHDLSAQALPFEAAVREADLLADARLERAAHEAERQAKAAQLAQMEVEAQQREQHLKSVQQRQRQRQAEWDELSRACGLPGLPLSAAPDWMARRQVVLQAVLEQAQAQDELAQWQVRVQGVHTGLRTALAHHLPDERDVLAWDWPTCLQRARAQLSLLTQAQGKQAELQRHFNEARAAQLDLQAQAEAAQAAWQDWTQRWRGALAQAGYAEDAQPERVEADLEAMTELEAHLTRMRSLQVERIDAMQKDLETLQLRARQVAGTLGLGAPDRPADVLVLELEHRLQAALDAQQQARGLQMRLDETREALHQAQALQRQVDATLAPMLEAAGVHALPELELAIERADRVRALKLSMDDLQQQLLAAGDGQPIGQLRAEVHGGCEAFGLAGAAARQLALADTGDAAQNREAGAEAGETGHETGHESDIWNPALADALQAGLQRLHDELTDNGERISKLSARHGVLRREFEALDGNDLAARAEAQRQEALAGMGEVMTRYLRLRTEARLLQWSLEKFRETQQGPMLARASTLFRELTLGSFQRLIVETGEGRAPPRLQGIRPDGSRVEVEGLSEGTRDQLYLALRLAALALQSEQGQSLPLIADDLFVNFDDQRTAAGLRVLGALSRQMQVIFLTHHTHLVPLAREVLGDDLNVVALG